ncbi:hypothetical protein [Candidatus Burkholderia verschuerenii]|uniref:hypothetical protein n=1 Tax=Candidatus Burkholderia verschuerenii TaxID=242163 RepID=UPI00067CBF2F|nr:hypothetical protein [Candidatus Burkholderia verschuerenii]
MAIRLPWASVEVTFTQKFERRTREGRVLAGVDLFGATAVMAVGGGSTAGRPRLPIRSMVWGSCI